MDENRIPGSIFSQPWWLDAVAEDCWDAIEIRSDKKLVARMPYVWSEKSKTQLTMPKLTQVLGPWVDLGSGKLATQLSRNKDLMNQLIKSLPTFKTFRQNFHYSVENWLPWYWAGFQQTTKYTYVIESLVDLDETWQEIGKSIKGDIRKAQKHVEVESPDDPREFFELNELVFKRQSKEVPYSRAFLEKLDDACLKRQQRKIFIARDSSGRTHAGCYIVWDSESAYYLMGGGDPELRKSGATSLCMWEAIKFASTVTKKFDFEGSMLEPVERFFRSFGATPKPYFAISKNQESNYERLARKVLRICKRSIFRS